MIFSEELNASKLANKIKKQATDDPRQYLNARGSLDIPTILFKQADIDIVKKEINRLKCSKSQCMVKFSLN